MSVETLTFGCRLNAYEAEVMKGEAEKAGLDNAVIINTCAVTAEAVRQAKQAVRKARRDHPEARIIVTGGHSATWQRSTWSSAMPTSSRPTATSRWCSALRSTTRCRSTTS